MGVTLVGLLVFSERAFKAPLPPERLRLPCPPSPQGAAAPIQERAPPSRTPYRPTHKANSEATAVREREPPSSPRLPVNDPAVVLGTSTKPQKEGIHKMDTRIRKLIPDAWGTPVERVRKDSLVLYRGELYRRGRNLGAVYLRSLGTDGQITLDPRTPVQVVRVVFEDDEEYRDRIRGTAGL